MAIPNTLRRKFSPDYSHDIENLACDDCLGRLEIARSVARQVLLPHQDDLPKVLGIYGSWGSGKSFLLSQVMNLLLEANYSSQVREKLLGTLAPDYLREAMHHRCLVATFKAWRYELEGDLAPGLVESISQVDEKFHLDGWQAGAPKRGNPRLKKTDEMKKIAAALRETLLDVVSGFEPTKPLVNFFRRLSKLQDEELSAQAKERSRIDQVRDKMQELVDKLLDSIQRDESDAEAVYRLVVVIDDLDRCSPENMVRLFEWLKNHLNVGRCVFILALDHEAAARAIVGRYKTYLGEGRDITYGYRYLEKLIDLEWELELSPDVEQMALREIDAEATSLARLIERRLGKVFPGRDDVANLTRLRCFGTPRTMLKIVNKCRLALDLLSTSDGQSALSKVKFGQSDYPFWLVLLTAMYYSLEPYELGEFSRETGIIYEVFSARKKDVPPNLQGTQLELCQYGIRFKQTSNLAVPTAEQIRFLLAVIRENALRIR